MQVLGLGSVLGGVPKASFPSPRAQTFSAYRCLEALHSLNALPCIVFTLLWMTILPFHCQEISCSNALQHLRGRYFQTGAVPLFVYSYRLAVLEDDSSRFERPWNAYCCSLYTLKDEDFSETTVLEQSLGMFSRLSERPTAFRFEHSEKASSMAFPPFGMTIPSISLFRKYSFERFLNRFLSQNRLVQK